MPHSIILVYLRLILISNMDQITSRDAGTHGDCSPLDMMTVLATHVGVSSRLIVLVWSDDPTTDCGGGRQSAANIS